MRREDIILFDHRGQPLRWWTFLPGYARNTVGFVSPQAREKQREYLGWRRDVRPPDLDDYEEAEGIWLEGEAEEEAEE